MNALLIGHAGGAAPVRQFAFKNAPHALGLPPRHIEGRSIRYVAKRTSFDPSKAYTKLSGDGSTPVERQMGIQMENFGAELRLTAEETQSLLIGCLAVAVAIVIFGVAMTI
jgi:hypothetical protein